MNRLTIATLCRSALDYPHPPIVEAVIDFQYANAFTKNDMHRVRDRLVKDYPVVEDEQGIEVNVSSSGIKTRKSFRGFKLKALNGSDICLIHENNFTTCRLAPYEGWGAFAEIAKRNFAAFSKALGKRQPRRIGLRYINRIDIPLEKIEGRQVQELFTVGPALPEQLSGALHSYSIKVEFTEANTESHVIVNSGTITPVLIDHIAVLLDIDASISNDISANEDAWWQQLSMLREVKNNVFENSITDELRGLFQ